MTRTPEDPREQSVMSSIAERPALVFIVDPRPADYADLRAMGDHRGLTFRCFSSGVEAFCAAAQIRPDLWIINVRLDDMSGFDLVDAVKTSLRRVDIFVVADDYSREDEVRALTASVAMYGCKPPRRAWLCDWRRMRERDSSPSQAPRPGRAALPGNEQLATEPACPSPP
jgi:DNA-binding response OmpR family regulator